MLQPHPEVTPQSQSRPNPEVIPKFRSELSELIRARVPLIQLVTFEEERAIEEIELVTKELGRKLLCWSTSKGVYGSGDEAEKPVSPKPMDDLCAAVELFERRARANQFYIFVLIDPNPYLLGNTVNPIYRRRLKDLAISIRTGGLHASCVLLSATLELPPELEKEATTLWMPIPSREDIQKYVLKLSTMFQNNSVITFDKGSHFADHLVDALVGMTASQIESVVARILVTSRHIGEETLEKVIEHKSQLIKKSGLLEYYDAKHLSFDHIGGLKALKKWLRIRDNAFSVAGREYGIAPPKGVLLTGVPGCGKSLSAKCVASAWKLPLIRLDMGRIYNRYIGSSEEHIRHAIATCEAVAPCILWIDEIEKGLPRNTGFVGDSGVSLRVLSSFLTWMQEKMAPVFVFATANQIDLLPPEILRRGRFDEIFFVDLPTLSERRDIITIHLKKAGRDPARYDLDELADLSGESNFGEGISLTGAEIEAWVNESLIVSFGRIKSGGSEESDLTMADLRTVIRRIVPLAKMRGHEIDSMRRWAAHNAIGAGEESLMS
jgi:ATP-dependent 26S proteasome regulatory subunit